MALCERDWSLGVGDLLYKIQLPHSTIIYSTVAASAAYTRYAGVWVWGVGTGLGTGPDRSEFKNRTEP